MTQTEKLQRIDYINSLYFCIQMSDIQIRNTSEKKDLMTLRDQLVDLTCDIIAQKKLINENYEQDQITLERLLSLD